MAGSALCAPEEYADIRGQIDAIARDAGRDPAEIGVGVPGKTDEEWLSLVEARRDSGVTHLCMRTLGGELGANEHLETAVERTTRRRLVRKIPTSS